MQAIARLAAQPVAVVAVVMALVAAAETLQRGQRLRAATVPPAATTAGQGEAVVVWARPNGIARTDLRPRAHIAVPHQVRNRFCRVAHAS